MVGYYRLTRYKSRYAGVAELVDARVLGARSLTEYRFESDHPHHLGVAN
jgi:hypothetical protein